MTRSKTFVVGTAVVAGAFAATIALSGSASAGGPSDATYSCQSITPPGPIVNNYPAVVSTFSTASSKVKMIAKLAPGIAIASNTINTTIKFNNSVGVVTYQSTAPTNLPSSAAGPVNVGPIPLAPTSPTPSGALHVIVGSGTPGPSNWSVHLVHVPTSTDIYCIGVVDFPVASPLLP